MSRIAILLVILCVAVFGCSQNSRKGGERGGEPVGIAAPDMDINSHEGHDHEMPAETGETAEEMPVSPHGNIGALDVVGVDPAVAAIYSGVLLTLVDVNTHEASQLVVPFGETVAIGDTGLNISVSSYFPDFVMTETGYGTRSMDENNPGAKVTVTGGEQEFSGWIFKLYPDMHPFENPNYNVMLEGGLRNTTPAE